MSSPVAPGYVGWVGKGKETTGSLLSRLPFQSPESPEGQLRNSYGE